MRKQRGGAGSVESIVVVPEGAKIVVEVIGSGGDATIGRINGTGRKGIATVGGGGGGSLNGNSFPTRDGSLGLTPSFVPAYANKEAFEAYFAKRHGWTVGQLHAYGFYGVPCDCGEAYCHYWWIENDDTVPGTEIEAG